MGGLVFPRTKTILIAFTKIVTAIHHRSPSRGKHGASQGRGDRGDLGRNITASSLVLKSIETSAIACEN